MKNNFFTQSHCSRCGNVLQARIQSWFNDDTICMECSDKEAKIKTILRDQGVFDAMEGCGFIPDVRL